MTRPALPLPGRLESCITPGTSPQPHELSARRLPLPDVPFLSPATGIGSPVTSPPDPTVGDRCTCRRASGPLTDRTPHEHRRHHQDLSDLLLRAPAPTNPWQFTRVS